LPYDGINRDFIVQGKISCYWFTGTQTGELNFFIDVEIEEFIIPLAKQYQISATGVEDQVYFDGIVNGDG
jgi:hypothetical protein